MRNWKKEEESLTGYALCDDTGQVFGRFTMQSLSAASLEHAGEQFVLKNVKVGKGLFPKKEFQMQRASGEVLLRAFLKNRFTSSSYVLVFQGENYKAKTRNNPLFEAVLQNQAGDDLLAYQIPSPNSKTSFAATCTKKADYTPPFLLEAFLFFMFKRVPRFDANELI
jgi:hypothetical protein